MPAISAVDAIGPAIQRTRNFLFRPFRWSTFLKLCLVAVLTEGFGGNSHFSMPGGHPSRHAQVVHTPFTLTPEHVAAIVAAALAFIVLGFVVAYLITRLRFAYFHCLIYNTREIRPGWELYRTQAGRFFWLSIMVGLCFLLLVAIIALPFVAEFWRLFHRTPMGSAPDLGSVLPLVLPLIPIILLIAVAAFTTDLILRDLMLPHYALENATAGQAWAAVWPRIMTEKGPFFVYALLRIILPIVAVMALFLALIIPGLIVVAVFAIVEVGIHSALAGTTGAAALIGILLQVLVGLVAFGIALFAALCLGGPLGTAIREYALLFYGARYQRLDEILFPPPMSA
jgi:MFS family permease